MKRLFTCYVVLIPILATSCIYDAPGDKFYRTLWKSESQPIKGLTIEFLCDGQIRAEASDAAGSYGFYESDDYTAWFTGLTLEYEDTVIIIESATRSGDTLTIKWHYLHEASIPYTSTLKRRSSYD